MLMKSRAHPRLSGVSETELRVELQARRRAVERAGGRRAEDSGKPVRALGDDARQREHDARVGGVSDLKR